MIQDETILHQKIEQLSRLYRALWHQYQELHHKNPERFRLFTEGTIEHIQRLIQELDDGCGVSAARLLREPTEEIIADTKTRKAG